MDASQPDYYELALKTLNWPERKNPEPSFFLEAPIQLSISSREPSPVSNALDKAEVKQSKRRYEPNSKNRRVRLKTEEDPFCKSAEDFNLGELSIRPKDQCSTPQSPSSPLITLPSKKLHGSARKLSIRRQQRSRMTFGTLNLSLINIAFRRTRDFIG